MRNVLFGIVFVLLLSACITARADELPAGTGYAPEDAVYTWMAQEPSHVANTLAIHQVIRLDDTRAFVLVSFRPQGWNDGLPTLALFPVGREENRWVAANPEYAGTNTSGQDLFTFYTAPAAEGRDWSAVYGLMEDDRVTHVELTWEDGLEQVVRVKNNTFISVRDVAALGVIKVTALDGAGDALSAFQDMIDEQ